MKYIAYLVGRDTGTIEQSGRSAEEAIESCIAVARRCIDVWVELLGGVRLPLDIVDKVPQTLPNDHGLLILERCDHGNGEPYDWRFFAVPYGLHKISPEYWSEEWTVECEVGKVPTKHSFVDSNSEYEFPLPEDSLEFIDGEWMPCRAAQYTY